MKNMAPNNCLFLPNKNYKISAMAIKSASIKNIMLLVVLVHCLTALNAQNLKLHYNPELDALNATSISDASGNGNDGSFSNGAKIALYDGIKVIDLGASNGYVNMGADFGNVVNGLQDFSIFCKVFIPSFTNLSSNGNFVWTFANSNDIAGDANGCLFFSAKNGRYAITPDRWTNESGIQTGSALQKGAWVNIAYVQSNDNANLYYNGILAESGTINMTPSELGKTTYNYLGRSCYASDEYLDNAKYADFRVYGGALSTAAVEELSGLNNSSASTDLLVEFDFSSTFDTKKNINGSLKNGASLKTYGPESVLNLGSKNGYFDLSAALGNIIETLDSFSVSSNLYIPESTNIGQNGNFIWTFANSNNIIQDANGNMFFTAISTRYAISKTDYRDESSVNANVPIVKGEWINVTYTQFDATGYVYINGELKASKSINLAPNELGSTAYNFLGRSCYLADSYLKNAQYSNFRIYNGAIGRSEIETIGAELDTLNYYLDSLSVLAAFDELYIENTDAIRSKIPLQNSVGESINVTWESSDANVVSNDGSVYRPAYGNNPVTVTLTATLHKNNFKATKDFTLTVLPAYSDEQSVDIDLSNLAISGNVNNAKTQLHLPYHTAEGSQISWSSDAPDFINTSGHVLKLSPLGSGKKTVLLTATASKGDVSKSRDFTVYIAEKEDKVAYLFSYFTGNAPAEEQIHFAISYDGLHYTALNDGKPVINSADIALKKSVRDPHILRGEDGNTFYMVVTDMRSSQGWSSNRGMVLLKSTDLINWTSSAIHFPDKWPEQWGNVTRVWAPQTVYDPDAGKYLVYFSLLTSDGKVPYDKVYYCYANEDFTDLEGEPQYFYDRGSATIDGDIIYNEADGLFHMFFKNEGIGGISKVTANKLTPDNGEPAGSQWSEPFDGMDQTDEAVEGSGVFRLINTDNWILMYDCYGAGHYQFCESSDLENFEFVQDNYSMDARHGTTIAITQEELKRLIEAFPSDALNTLEIGARSNNIRAEGIMINEASNTISIPLVYGTELSSFDPEFFATAGTKVSPEGTQDFSNGDVSYTFVLNDKTETYTVKAEVWANPVLPGFRADPEVLYSEKTGLFYIYPTSDGFPGWGGYYFDVFSSPDLVNWTNEGTFLDLSSEQVSWASGNAWAPCIEEKEIAPGQYRYYFYFSGESGGKKTGVAVADHPTGPFVDLGYPMINANPEGIGGQIIDSDVFTDLVSGKSYIYWGNGYMAVAELNDDMVSYKEETVRVITPQGGTLNSYAYREGAYVFYRNGTYYFLWSVDDTGSPNYHVAYGTSDSPTGPIDVADDPIVIQQDPENDIYGTAHNSVLQIPGRDEWYIVYHRINKNYLDNGPGYHREVCIDRMHFNADGTIKKITPTHKGIEAVDVKSAYITALNDFDFNPQIQKGEIINQEFYNALGQLLSLQDLSAQTGLIIVVNHFKDGHKESKKKIFFHSKPYNEM